MYYLKYTLSLLPSALNNSTRRVSYSSQMQVLQRQALVSALWMLVESSTGVLVLLFTYLLCFSLFGVEACPSAYLQNCSILLCQLQFPRGVLNYQMGDLIS